MYVFPNAVTGFASEITSSPKKSPICPVAIVTATPAVNPTTIVYGMNFTSPPNLKAPKRIKKIP